MLDSLPINFDLMKNPLNWAIVFLMIYLFLIPFSMLDRKFSGV